MRHILFTKMQDIKILLEIVFLSSSIHQLVPKVISSDIKCLAGWGFLLEKVNPLRQVTLAARTDDPLHLLENGT